MPHRDLEHLVSAISPCAREMIAKHREFHPFGAHMTPDGEVVTHAHHALAAQGSHAHAGAAHHGVHDDHHAHVKEEIDQIAKDFRLQARAGEARAVAICTRVRTIPPGKAHKTHAICISVEHESGTAIDHYIPYEKGWFGRIHFGATFSQSRPPRIFDGPSGAAPTRRVG